MSISLATAREICSKTELELVRASSPSRIGTLTIAELKQQAGRARRLRDKWRDLTQQQTRQTKSGDPARLGEANQRSAEKAQLFDETLARFQQRLSKMSAGESPAPRGAAVKKTPRKKRAVEHRATRASVRKALDERRAAKNEAAAKKQAKASRKKASASEASASKPAPAKKTSRRAAKASAPRTGTQKSAGKKGTAATPTIKKSAAKKRAARAAAASPDPSPTSAPPIPRGKKPSPTTAAKKARILQSGSRKIQTHLAAQGKRTQARRDSR